jgi:hypothetical protein
VLVEVILNPGRRRSPAFGESLQDGSGPV